MALARPLFVGFSSASKVAREGGDLEVTVQTARGPCTFTLPWFFVRDVDALLERWRREEHEAELLTMHAGNLEVTLCCAALAGGLRDTVFLIASGADVNWLCPAEEVHLYEDIEHTAVAHAAERGHLAVVTALLDAGAEIHDGFAICWASVGGHTPVVALLLDRGADVNYGDGIPLRNAAREGRLETTRLLLDRGANVHAFNEDALRSARRGGHDAVVALLLEHGAVDVDEEEEEG